MYDRTFEHAYRDGSVATSPGLVDLWHRQYAEAVHFMRRSGRDDVPIEAIVALVAFLRKDCEAPSAQLVEDMYWELVAESRNAAGRNVHRAMEEFYDEFEMTEEDHELLKQFAAKPEDTLSTEASTDREQGENQVSGPARRGREFRTPDVPDRQGTDARIIRFRDRAPASGHEKPARTADGSFDKCGRSRTPASEATPEHQVNPLLLAAFARVGTQVRRNIQETSDASR
ncbi:hypothetical protein HNR01_002294 [Methylorubrum rhodesianum]|uniref:hypothetical protein n=1 Tax=Methylorubrum TaxID=2282523 RepID=UPI0016202998|nr:MULTISPECIES: hypothetical protein [Methylorubrum]MBB5762668.1 hypothetical protein [Methylorubrum rhodesianum]MBI1688498.1 hypothetical protein [Methylorubrum sp. DB1722]